MIKCKFCDMVFTDADSIAAHLEKKHIDMIPKDMTSYQFYYYIKTGKTHGSCVMCKSDTSWNNITHKYKRFCDNPKCKEKYTQVFRSRMLGKYGKTTLLNDPDHQRKMLANRKISNVYTWSDRVHTTPYTGTYELSFLEFLDEVMNFDPTDVISPSPHTYYYEYEGTKHFYIPDFFIPSLKLEIEIKDGNSNIAGSNMHPKIVAVDRVKEELKDNVMKSNLKTFNYLKITNKNNAIFFKFLEEAKRRYNKNNNECLQIFMV